MVKYFILVKSKRSKKWNGILPTDPSFSLALIRKIARKQMKKRGWNYKIITETQKNVILNKLKKIKIKRKRKLRTKK